MTTPKDAAPKATHKIADGHQLSVRGKLQTAGFGVSAEDFRNKADPDGSKGLQRLVDSGRVVKAGAAAVVDAALGGTTKDLEQAANPDAERDAKAAEKADPAKDKAPK